jgi:hypothetical protein
LPKKLHRKLLLAAKRQGLSGERRDAYVYGTMKRVEAGARNPARSTTKGPEKKRNG